MKNYTKKLYSCKSFLFNYYLLGHYLTLFYVKFQTSLPFPQNMFLYKILAIIELNLSISLEKDLYLYSVECSNSWNPHLGAFVISHVEILPI